MLNAKMNYWPQNQARIMYLIRKIRHVRLVLIIIIIERVFMLKINPKISIN